MLGGDGAATSDSPSGPASPAEKRSPWVAGGLPGIEEEERDMDGDGFDDLTRRLAVARSPQSAALLFGQPHS